MSQLQRTSISLPEPAFVQLDQLCAAKGYRNRSHALASLIGKEHLQLQNEAGTALMAGTITMVVDEDRLGLLGKLSALVRRRVDEVIASLSIPLKENKRLEIWVVQGPSGRLHELVQQLQALRGVSSSSVSLSPTLLPPIHERPRIASGKLRTQGSSI